MKIEKKIAVCNVKRTPFGQISKSLSNYKSQELGLEVSKDILKTTSIQEKIDGVIVGESSQIVPNSARIIANLLSLRNEIPCLVLNQNCVSSLEAVAEAARRIILNEGEVFLTIGQESLTNTPFVFEKARANKKTSSLEKLKKNLSSLPEEVEIKDALGDTLGDMQTSVGMAVTAEIVAQNYNISKELSDKFAYESFRRSWEGFNNQKYQEFLIDIQDEKGNLVEIDEAVLLRKGIVENPSRMKKAMLLFDNNMSTFDQFKEKYKEHLQKTHTPTVSIFNSCARSDGAAACILTTVEKAKELNLDIQCLLTGFKMKGVSPNIMGIGQAASSLSLIQEMNDSVEEIDQIEIHEAFSGSVIGALEEIKKQTSLNWEKMFEEEKINAFGGSIAIGHPFGATGIRLIVNSIMSFRQNEKTKKILVTACAHGGIGGALMLERFL